MIDNIHHVHWDIYDDHDKWRKWAEKVDSFTPAQDPEFGRDLGLGHWFEMSRIASEFVAALGGSEREILLADIAGMLCGCGLTGGFHDYAKRGGEIAYDYLTERYYSSALNGIDIDIICHAIADHTTGDDIKSIVGAALCFADKVDIGRSRVKAKKPATEIQKAMKKLGHASYYVVPDDGGMISINYDTGGNFEPFKFMKLWPDVYQIPHKAALFLGRPFGLFLNENTLLWKPDAVINDDDVE